MKLQYNYEFGKCKFMQLKEGALKSSSLKAPFESLWKVQKQAFIFFHSSIVLVYFTSEDFATENVSSWLVGEAH